MLDDAIVNHLVPDRMWRVVRECLHRPPAPWPIDRAGFAVLVMCAVIDVGWTEIPLNELDFTCAGLAVICLIEGVWDALLSDADVMGDRWTRAIAIAGGQRARRDWAAARSCAERQLSTRDGGGCG